MCRFSRTYDLKEGAWAPVYKAENDGLTEILGVNASGDSPLLGYFLMRPLGTKLDWVLVCVCVVICYNPVFPISPVTFSIWFETLQGFPGPHR